MSLFSELKRRNVFKVAAMYAVVGWLIIQVIGSVAEPLGFPDWIVSFVIVIVGLGFPLALVFAWAFELTPDGLKKTEDVDPSQSVTPETGNKLNYLTVGALVLALGYIGYAEMGGESPPIIEEGVSQDLSIAVLPFVNLSSDPEQEYFSDGITEEILNALAKIRDLQVTARTSAFAYKGQNLDLRQVGQELGVKNILEGSVRKAGNQIRITAQLIEAESGFHLWSDTFDRDLENIFQMQEEISIAIADALSATLHVTSGNVLSGRTQNMEAYDLYLKALGFLRERVNIGEAERLMRRATELDPNFAAAWASLAHIYDVYTIYEAEVDPEILANFSDTTEAMKAAAQKAYDLDPEMPRALHVMGLSMAIGRSVQSQKYLEKAIEIDPSNTEVMEDMLGNMMMTGLTEEAVRFGERIVALDPTPLNKLMLTMALTGDGQYERAKEIMWETAKGSPHIGPLLWFGKDAFYLTKDYDGFGEYIKLFKDESSPRVQKAYLETMEEYRFLMDNLGEGGVFPSELISQILSNKTRLILNAQNGNFDLSFDNPTEGNWMDRGGTYNKSWVFNDEIYTDFRKSSFFKEFVKSRRYDQFWKIYGYPRSCRPVGSDDFECGAVQ